MTCEQIDQCLAEWGVLLEETPSAKARRHSGRIRLGGDPGYDVQKALTAGEASERVEKRLNEARKHCCGTDRHSHVRDDVLALAGLGKRGEPGVSGAIRLLRTEFIEQVGPDRGYDVAAREFDSFLDPKRLEERLDDEENVEDNPFDGDPIPLTHRVDIPEFPVDALAAPHAEMVNAISDFTQTDPAMAATSALSVLSACNGGRAEIEIRPGWREPLNEYFATIAVSGERKSAVQSAMTRPLFDVEERLAAAARDARRDAEEHKRVAMQAVETQRRVAARGGGR